MVSPREQRPYKVQGLCKGPSQGKELSSEQGTGHFSPRQLDKAWLLQQVKAFQPSIPLELALGIGLFYPR